MTKRITKEMLNVANMPDTPTARKILARMLDDDDIQDYVRPWVGLTEEERKEIWNVGEKKDQALRAALIQTIRDVEAKLKEKNT
jgi:hypothetical protein